jgi:hypothetical protein
MQKKEDKNSKNYESKEEGAKKKRWRSRSK